MRRLPTSTSSSSSTSMTMKTWKTIVYGFFLLLFVVCLVYFHVIVKLLLVSVMLAYVLHPAFVILTGKGMNRRLAAIMVLIVVSAAVIGFVFIVVPGMMVDLLKSVGKLETLDILQWLPQDDDMSPVMADFLQKSTVRMEKWSVAFLNGALKQLTGFLTALPAYVLAPIFAYYFLIEPEWFIGFLMRFVPFQARDKAAELVRMIDEVVGGFVRSQVVLGIIVGILTYLVMLVFHVKYPFIIAVVNGLANIIPYFGPILGIVPALLAALSDSTVKAATVAVLLLLVQQLESNVISPKLTGDSIDMHPVLVMLLLLAGGELFGFWGLLFSVPVGGAARVVWKYAFRNLF